MASAVETLRLSAEPAKLFFIISGEHPTLPTAEIHAILEANGIKHETQLQSYRLLTITALREALSTVYDRSLMFERAGIELGSSDLDLNEIAKLVRGLSLEEIAGASETFAVRSTRLGGLSKPVRRVQLEGYVGSLIKEHAPNLKVNLNSPGLTFLCVIFGDQLILGLQSYVRPTGPIHSRRPRKRPVFHPATMPPKIARCMVNLARAKPNEPFSDPFCGIGGVLIEAGLIGCEVVGVDASRRMLRGAARNLAHFNVEPLGLVHGDARKLPFGGLRGIATDPPYGRDSSTMGTKVSQLIQDFLPAASQSLVKGGHLCISAPSQVSVSDFGRDAGLTFVERHLVRIHRSLTRQFVVFRKP